MLTLPASSRPTTTASQPCPTRADFGSVWKRTDTSTPVLIVYGTGYWCQLTYEPVGGGPLRPVMDDGLWVGREDRG